MPKAEAARQSRGETETDRKRKGALERFFGLTDKALKHIEQSIEANKACYLCRGMAKPDVICPVCLATGVVPDIDQRNWATEQIVDRIAPKPKSIELGPDKTVERQELEEQISQLTESDLDAQLKALGIITAGEGKD